MSVGEMSVDEMSLGEMSRIHIGCSSVTEPTKSLNHIPRLAWQENCEDIVGVVYVIVLIRLFWMSRNAKKSTLEEPCNECVQKCVHIHETIGILFMTSVYYFLLYAMQHCSGL